MPLGPQAILAGQAIAGLGVALASFSTTWASAPAAGALTPQHVSRPAQVLGCTADDMLALTLVPSVTANAPGTPARTASFVASVSTLNLPAAAAAGLLPCVAADDGGSCCCVLRHLDAAICARPLQARRWEMPPISC
jgi:hypothetical protein